MHDSDAPVNIGKKSAQAGFSVTVLNRSLFTIDIKKQSVLYLLPTKTPDATDFSSNRFDPMLESSEHLANLFCDVKNTGSKRAGSAVLYIRGANSRAGLKSIPVANIVFDEFDEMPPENIPLARERTSGQRTACEWLVSTPTIPNTMIDAEFQTSTQEHFYFPCPCCSRWIELLPDNLVVTADDINDPRIKESYIKCLDCDNPLFKPDDYLKYPTQNEVANAFAEIKSGLFEKHEWRPTGIQNRDRRGFYVNQLYSSAKSGMPHKLAEGLIAGRSNKSAEQEYFNSKMGLAHEVDGARISESDIIECVKPGLIKLNGHPSTHIVTMGVDVGAWLHIEIDRWEVKRRGNDLNINSVPTVIWEGKRQPTAGFHELDELMRIYNVRHCVIDANPERASAVAFARRFWKFVSLCIYARGVNTKELTLNVGTDGDFKISIDRTMWLDIALGRFHNKTILLPGDLSMEYKNNLQNIARHYEEDGDGNQVGKYITSGGNDHFAHARNYAEIALPLAASRVYNSDVKAFL